MRINSIDVAAFGKLRDFHLELSDGVTVIFGENEKGKTTLMTFIRMMFYGNSGKVSDAERNPRVKYRPWSSDIMAGSITFTHGGTRYRLEREFKKNNSTDRITLINLDLNTVQSLSGSDDIGVKFFGLTEAAFERSVFIGELGAPAKNEAADGEINSRLSNIAVTGDEDISFEAVCSRLQKAKEELMSKSGKKGKYDKALLRLVALENDIKTTKSREAEAERLQRQIEVKEAEIKASSAETSRLFELLKNADKIKKRIFVQRYIDAERELADCNKKLLMRNGCTADEAYIAEADRLYSDTVRAFERLKAIEAERDIINGEISRLDGSLCESQSPTPDTVASAMTAERDNIDKRIDEVREEAMKLHTDIEGLMPEKKINPLFFAIGAVIAAVGVIFTGIQLYVAIGLLSAGIITAICGLIFKRSIKPDDSTLRAELARNSKMLSTLLDQKQTLLERIAEHEKGVNAVQLKQAAEKALLESKKQEAIQKSNEYTAATKAYNQTKEALFAHLSELSQAEDMASAKKLIDDTAEAVRYADRIMQKLTLLADHAGCSSLTEAEEKMAAYSADATLADMSEAEIDTVKERFKVQSDLTGKMRSELAALKAQIKAISEDVGSAEVLIRDRAELVSQIESYKTFCGSVDLATAALEEAFREMRKNYSGVLDSRTAEIFNLLSDEKYKSVSVSKNFELNVTTDEAFGLKASAYLSDGTEDQLYLSLRLAVAELITENDEALPIFMDDPLSNFDDGRAYKAISFLKSYSKERQIIMFTCHSSFADMTKDLSINIKEL